MRDPAQSVRKLLPVAQPGNDRRHDIMAQRELKGRRRKRDIELFAGPRQLPDLLNHVIRRRAIIPGVPTDQYAGIKRTTYND